MRKLIGVLAISVVAVAMVPATALATHSNGQGPSKDFVTGTLKLALPTPLGTFPGQIHNNGSSESASGPGVPATGHFYTDIFDTPFGTVNLSGDIVCLTAIGNNAWLRSVITSSNTGLAPPGFGLLSRIVDNGEGADDPPDSAVGFLTPPPGPNPTCPTVPFTTNPSNYGNTTVHDGV